MGKNWKISNKFPRRWYKKDGTGKIRKKAEGKRRKYTEFVHTQITIPQIYQTQKKIYEWDDEFCVWILCIRMKIFL